MNRQKEIIKTSLIGIITNISLVTFKTVVGIISNSISIIMDALNNLSDALSSIITIIGMALASKAPDKEHPYGHGKIEHISSLLIAIIILATGIISFYESAKNIFHPKMTKYTITILIIVAAGVITKFLLGRYFVKKSNKLNSDALKASGVDALFDSIISFSTLIGALINYYLKFNIDGYLGAMISLVLIKTGYEIISESFDEIIGKRIDSTLSIKLKKRINEFKEVLGTYDLILHQYGPEKIIGSIHIEVEDSITAKEIHSLTREITSTIFYEFGIILTVGIYATNTDNDEYMEIKKTIKDIIKKYPNTSQLHGFYVDRETQTISFDLIFDYKEKNVITLRDEISKELNKIYPNYKFNILIDNDFSD